MKIDYIDIPQIALQWSDWHRWESFHLDARSSLESIRIPARPGVYEVKYFEGDELLTIGKAADLRMRVKQGLVRGKIPHSAGKRIRAVEDISLLVVRWAETERPAAVEEELHRHYKATFGQLPRHTLRT